MNNEKITWELLCSLEPRLLDLLAEVRAIKDDKSKPSFCANAVWYGEFGHPGIKPKLIHLVGWHASGTDRRLRSPEAYDLATNTLYNALPDCRGDCFCL